MMVIDFRDLAALGDFSALGEVPPARKGDLGEAAPALAVPLGEIAPNRIGDFAPEAAGFA